MSSISSSSNNNTSNTNAYTNGDDHHLCDESRCISIGFREEQKEDQFFDCYMPRSSIVVTEDEANLNFVDDDMVPIEIAATASFDDGSDLCSKGYAAQLVLNEPFIQRFGVKYAYYTCCIHTTHRQNTEEGDEAVITNSNKKDQIDVYDYSFTRHCSDPKYFANKKITMPCDDINTTRIYPRQMLHMRDYPRSYVCCDTKIDDYSFQIGQFQPSTATGTDRDMDENHSSASLVCDESKCLSDTIWRGSVVYDCWALGPDTIVEFKCAENYTGITIVNEPTINPEDVLGSRSLGDMLLGNTTFQYYTCCRPSSSSSSLIHQSASSPPAIPAPASTTAVDNTTLSTTNNIRRHCSNPIAIQPNHDMTCNTKYQNFTLYPRRMYGYIEGFEAYMCCDEPPITPPLFPVQTNDDVDTGINDNDASSIGIHDEYQLSNFIDEVDCVPYCCCESDSIQCTVTNSYGRLEHMYCDDKIFQYPHPVETFPLDSTRNWLDSITYFECCKSVSNTNRSLLVQNTPAFIATIYPQIFMSAIGLLFSLTVSVSILMPSILNKIRAIKSKRRSNIESHHFATRQQNSAQHDEQCYVAYNLYPVFLSIPDMSLNAFLLILYSGYATDNEPKFGGYITSSKDFNDSDPDAKYDVSLIYTTCVANMYLNCVVAYQVYVLLRDSHNRKRTKPPSSKMATIQACIVFLSSFALGLIRFFLQTGTMSYSISVALFFMLSSGVPIIFLLYICTRICIGGFIPKGSRVRELALYFLRIILVYILFWLPGMILFNISYGPSSSTSKNPSFYSFSLLIFASQPIASSIMILTKSDIRKSVLKLVTFQYCRSEQQNDTTSGL